MGSRTGTGFMGAAAAWPRRPARLEERAAAFHAPAARDAGADAAGGAALPAVEPDLCDVLRRRLELHDPVTGSHLTRLPEYTRILAQQVAGLPRYRNAIPESLLAILPQASTLHDVGKLGVPRRLLQKAGRLTVDEFTVMKRHTTRGGRTLRQLARHEPDNLLLCTGEQIAMYHHERWDGGGYPFGLRGAAIPLAARIVAVADVYDALTSVRPYKPAYSHDAARRFIVQQAGTHFDPDVVEAFVLCEASFPRVRQRLREGTTTHRAPSAA